MPGIFLKSPSEPFSPGSIPYAENDKAIVRGVTKGFLDVSNSVCYSGAGKLDTTTPLQDLVYGAPTVTPNGVIGTDAAPGISGGMIQSVNATGNGGALITLNSSWLFPNTAKRVMVGFWCKMPLSGYGNTGTTYMAIMTSGTNTTPGNYQYVFGFRIDNGTVISADKAISFGTAALSVGSPASYIAAICDGNLHQVQLFVDIRSGVQITKMFIDGALWGSAATLADTVIGTPGVTPVLVGGGGFSPPTLPAIRAGNAKFGRFQVHNLTGTEIDPLTIVQADYQMGVRYLS